MSRVRLLFALCLFGLLGLVPSAGLAISADIVISQVYGGGGNTGAQFKNDYVELFNRGSTPVDVSGWSVQYASATGNTWTVTNLLGTIAPGRYYLVVQGAGAGAGADLPAPDAVGTAMMSANNGKVALVTSTAALTCGAAADCLPNPNIKDFVGYGTANNFEGAGPAPALTNTTAALRANNGCSETDNNSSDFTSLAPTPRNSASPANPCGGAPSESAPAVASTSPATGATAVAPGANITITFSEPVNVSGSWFAIACSSSGAHTATVTGGPTGFTLNPNTDFAVGETCTVTVVAAQVLDQDANDPPDAMAANYVFSFATAGPSAQISEIQGAAHVSLRSGQSVTVEGVVTAKRSNGFYLQDPTPDGNEATSDAIFVFTSSAPASVTVGDAVTVSGTVSEFRPAATNLSITQIGSPTITVASGGNALPAPTVIGTGGRTPPAATIEDDVTGSVEEGGTFDPASDGIDFYESLEAMLVQVNNPVAVGPRNDFGEIPVLADNGANAGLRTGRGGVIIRPVDFNPERIILDDVIAPTPAANVRDTFSGPAVGVVDYSFANFKLLITQPLSAVAGGLTREVAAAPQTNRLTVATFNVENLDPGDPAAKVNELAALIVTNLRSPDLLSLEEVQDNNGATNDTVVDASASYTTLINAIRAAGGPTYQFRQIDPADDQDGGEPGGNIRVGFLFRTDRGLAFVDRPGGTSTSATTVVRSGSRPQLSASPGRIDPTKAAFTASRKPLAGEFLYNGHRLFVIANHFSSKGADQPLFGRFQPPTRSTETQRTQQAQAVNTFVDALLAADRNARIIVLGDINDFQFSSVMETLKGGVLTNLTDTLPENERYTYVFEGNSQALDHILVSASLARAQAQYDIVHVNSEFAAQASDHDPALARFLLPRAVVRVTVRSLTAARTRQTVTIRWRTASNQGLRGFNLYRVVNGRREKVNRSLIRSRGSRGTSYSYRYRVARGKRAPALFRLETVHLDGVRAWRSVRVR